MATLALAVAAWAPCCGGNSAKIKRGRADESVRKRANSSVLGTLAQLPSSTLGVWVRSPLAYGW